MSGWRDSASSGKLHGADHGEGCAPAVAADDLALVAVLNRLFSDVTEATGALVAVLIDVEIQQQATLLGQGEDAVQQHAAVAVTGGPVICAQPAGV